MDDKEATLGKISKTYCLLNKYRIKKCRKHCVKKNNKNQKEKKNSKNKSNNDNTSFEQFGQFKGDFGYIVI